MENKKISFSFIKMKKPDKSKTVEKMDYIECLEEKSIKILGGEPVKETTPLIIPMKPNNLITAERLKQIAEEVEKFVEEPKLLQESQNKIEERLDLQNEDLEQMAVRELLQEAKKDKEVVDKDLTLPVINKNVIDGEKESTLEDYEAVPIQEFGMAMLRGMGWTPGQEKSKHKQPELRPKGLGLGADKVVTDNQKKSASDKDEELSIVKNAFVKVTRGKYCGCYGKVVSLDEDTGRVVIELAVKKESVSLSEFMLQPVPQSEFHKQSKVINSDKYEEYKKNALITSKHSDTRKYDNGASSSQRSHKDKSKEASSSQRSNEIQSNCKQPVVEKRGSIKDCYRSSNRKNNFDNRSSSSSEDRSQKRREELEKYTSCKSVNSFPEIGIKDRYKENKKYQSTSSESDCSDHWKHKKSKKREKNITQEKRDIDKKRKGKKKKRDRDRSPNCRKYRNKDKITK